MSRGILRGFFVERSMIFHIFCTLSKIIVAFCQIFMAGFPKFQSMCRRKILREKKVTKRWFLSNFVLWFKNIGHWAKQFGRGCQSCIWRVQRKLLSIFLWKKQWFLNDFRTLSRKVPYFAKILRQGFRNFTLRVRRRILREKNGKRDDFSVILYFEWKTLDFGQNNSARAIKASFRVSRRISWAFLIEKTMIFEWNLYFEQKISGLSQNFTAGFPKLQSMCPEKICERDKFWKSDDFLVILYSKFKKLDFGQKSLARVVKAAIGVSRGIFWAFFIEKTMIFEWNLYFEQKKFRTLPKLYGRISETSIYVSGENLWER